MKKQTLLGAAALTTLAVAGAAHAGTLSPNAAGTSIVTQNRVIATEAAAASLSGTVSLALTPSDNAILPQGNAILKISLDGGATFGAPVTSAAIGGLGGCAPTVTPSAGGGKDDSSVTFLVSTLNNCKGAMTSPAAPAQPITIDIPVKLNGTSNVNVSTDLRTEAGTAIDGATASTFKPAAGGSPAVNLFSFAPAFALKVTPAAAGNVTALLPDFKALGTNKTLGTAEVTVASNAYTGIGTGSRAVAAGDVTAVKYAVKGAIATVDIGFTGADVTAGNVPASGVVNASGPAAVTFAAAPKSTPVAIAASTYTVAADLTLDSAFAAQGAYAAQSLRSIVRDGASYMVPWVASGTLATSSTSNTVIRIANVGAKTGPVSLELLTSSAGTPVSTTLIPVAASIAKGGEVVLTSGQIETLVGANFGRGDIRLTVEAQPADLIVRRFVQSTVNGALSEVSLGRSAAGAEPQN
ncbi:hypothetical protein [Brevundimonas sp.]|uniref:hypothetical protein n=1 Tax=Brevundimonas sp. TaxID=1871086 RepID=UPI00289FB58A|nr:hypothetical protein [Brevundimonas sp.]